MATKPRNPWLKSDHPLVPNLRGAWLMSEGEGLSTRDFSGGGHDGTLVNMTSGSAWRYDSRRNVHLDFFRSNDYVNCGTGAALNLTSVLSVFALVYIRQNTNTFLCKSDESGNDDPGYVLDTNPLGRLRFFGYEGSSAKGFLGSDNSLLPQNEWVDVAGTFDGTTWRVYINGTEVDGTTSAATLNTTTDPLVLAARNTIPTNPLIGKMESACLYDSALTAAQVKSFSDDPYQMFGDFQPLGGEVGAWIPTISGDNDAGDLVP